MVGRGIPPDPDVYALDLVTTVLGQGRRLG
jgi:hypothetical protein